MHFQELQDTSNYDTGTDNTYIISIIVKDNIYLLI